MFCSARPCAPEIATDSLPPSAASPAFGNTCASQRSRVNASACSTGSLRLRRQISAARERELLHGAAPSGVCQLLCHLLALFLLLFALRARKQHHRQFGLAVAVLIVDQDLLRHRGKS